MAKSVLTILGFIMFLNQVKAQQESGGYKIYYKMVFQKDSNNAALTSEMTELLINGEKSLFRSVYRAERDTHEYHKELEKQPYAFAYTDAPYRILKDYTKLKTHYYEKVEIFVGPMLTYAEPQDSMAWTLTKDILTIGDLTCQKAVLGYGNRYWEAWFCPDIPISDGPYKFWGLPGLIVQIRDSTDSWVFSLTSIQRVASFTFDLHFLDGAENMEKKAFYKRKRYYRDNMTQIAEASGNIEFPNESIRQAAYKSGKEQAAKDNNWIERYP